MQESRVKIIAEAGVNHNGDIGRAIEMVHAAAEAGADIVKFQTFSAERLTTASAQKAVYQKNGDSDSTTQYEMLRKFELSEPDYPRLLSECESTDVEFLSTGFDIEDLEFLVDLGIRRIKIPSGEITHVPYLRAAAGFGLPMIVSTGMSRLEEVETAVGVLKRANEYIDLTLLHCTSAYPTILSDVNLRAMQTMQERCQLTIGYSDHTVGIRASSAAVALGARIIEKHFTLDKELSGPDHQASATVEEFTELVCAIRETECLLGRAGKEPASSEIENLAIVRRSIVAKKSIKKGDLLTAANLCCKRTGVGVGAEHWDELIGQVSGQDYEADESIEW